MSDRHDFIDESPVQDRDLLFRMSIYLDSVESKMRQGQGWFIFNADGGRSGRVSNFIQQRLADQKPPVSLTVMPWRDFSLNAFVMEVGLPQLEPVARSAPGNARPRREYDFARKVTGEVWERLQDSDLLMVAGVQPRHAHELVLLDRAIDERYNRRRATILMAPGMPHDLESRVESLKLGKDLWDRVFTRMYETSLVAL